MSKQSSFQAKPNSAALARSTASLLEPQNGLGLHVGMRREAAGVETDAVMGWQGQFAPPSLGWDLSSVPAYGGAASGGASGHPADRRTVTHMEHNRQRLSASIRRVNRWPSVAAGNPTSVAREVYQDAAAGGGDVPIDFTALSAPTTAAVAEPREGQTVTLPDIVIPAMAGVPEADAISSTVNYNPTITQTGPPPTPFGETSPYDFSLSGISVTSASSTYTVSATLDNPIVFQVNGGGDTDISSENDPDITQANYATVASDLTPDMSDLNGRPPRTQFWAEDLCIRHERFHATEGEGYSRNGVTQAQAWLNSQTAGSVAAVNALLAQVPGRVADVRRAAMTFPGREERAYSDGAPLYLVRANAIRAKGTANGYVSATAPSGAPASSAAPGSGGLSRGAKVGIGIAGGAAVGAGIGALAGGGVGALVGAGVGAVAGLVGGLLV
jgi:hypothetical protein